MAQREIVIHPDPVLRNKAKKVRKATPQVQQLIDDMVETMRVAPGVGLAAPQLGVGQRIIVIEFAEPSEDPEQPPKEAKLYAVINPEITRSSSETETGVEGCLSIPGYLGEVERHSWVTIKGQNRHGQPFRLKAKGWLARIFQHEIDHLNGVLFLDLATHVWKAEPEDEEAAIPLA